MASDLQQLEQRISQLEQQLGGGQGAQGASGGQGAGGQGAGGGSDPAVVEAFFKGALLSGALAQGAAGQGQPQQGGQGAQFMSIFACTPSGGGGGGFTPTQYDSFLWCRSRFFCNPQSLSCLC